MLLARAIQSSLSKDVLAKTLTGAKPSYTFNVPGIYIVTLNVEDAAGNKLRISCRIHV